MKRKERQPRKMLRLECHSVASPLEDCTDRSIHIDVGTHVYGWLVSRRGEMAQLSPSALFLTVGRKDRARDQKKSPSAPDRSSRWNLRESLSCSTRDNSDRRRNG